MLAAQQAGVPVFEYAAREIKMSTVGSGAASKQQADQPPDPQSAPDEPGIAQSLTGQQPVK